MPKKIVLSDRLSTEELLAKYRNTSNAIERSHYQIIWLLSTGKKPLLNDVQQAQLHQVLSAPAESGGLWNGRKVAEWMSEITGQKVSRHRGWEYLKQMQYSLRVPRPQHREVSIEEQLEWKKNSI